MRIVASKNTRRALAGVQKMLVDQPPKLEFGCATKPSIWETRAMKAQSSLRNLLVGAVALMAVPAASYAATVSYQFGLDFSSGGDLGTPPFGTITLTDSGANLNVSVTLAPNYTFAQTGSG